VLPIGVPSWCFKWVFMLIGSQILLSELLASGIGGDGLGTPQAAEAKSGRRSFPEHFTAEPVEFRWPSSGSSE